jgi:hypothetical protein
VKTYWPAYIGASAIKTSRRGWKTPEKIQVDNERKRHFTESYQRFILSSLNNVGTAVIIGNNSNLRSTPELIPQQESRFEEMGVKRSCATSTKPCGTEDAAATSRRITRTALTHLWQPIASAPYELDLELAVIDRERPHAPVFACQRYFSGWSNAKSGIQVDVRPTHWRLWTRSSYE